MRYAIYFAPPATDPVSRVATNWLGRNAFTDETVEPAAITDLSAAEIAIFTTAPRRYGFHGTLKAPFRLAEGVTENALERRLSSFAGATQAFEIPSMSIRRIGPFFALVPTRPVPELGELAGCVTRAFEDFRAPLTAAEIERRNPEKLSPAQLANLHRWGYPYVFDEFRFHMTLTGPIDADQSARVEQALQRFFEPVLSEAVEVRNIALFVEVEPGAPFRAHSLLPLAGAEGRQSA
jgi:putative phosphonate metabolism protein